MKGKELHKNTTLSETRKGAVEIPLEERQLFVDDHLVREMVHLTRTMHSPVKKGTVIRPDRGEHAIQTRSAPFWDPGDEVFKYWVHGCRESPDGLNWKRMPHTRDPEVGRCVIYDPVDPDSARRYKAWSPETFHVSEDGRQWRQLDVEPIPAGDDFNFSLDRKRRLYLATVKHPSVYGRSIWLSTSSDFEAWSKPELIFEADELDQELARRRIRDRFGDPARHHPYINIPSHYGVDIYNMGVFRYESVYIGLPSFFHHTGTVRPHWPGFARMDLVPAARDYISEYGDYSGFHHVQLACSRDLRHWTRLGDRRPFIDCSPLGGGAHDVSSVRPASDALVRGDELWFYYTGGRYYEIIRLGEADVYAICLAVLRRDGFVSLDAGDLPGSVSTPALVVPQGARRLFVNADLAAGELRAVVLDPVGRPLEGFSDPQVLLVPGKTTETCPIPRCSNTIRGDLARAELVWKSHGDLEVLAGRTVNLRFTLSRGSLYSFWFE